MAIGSSTVKMSEINTELGRSSNTFISLTDAATGVYVAINTDSPMYPNADGVAPHQMQDWQLYDHDYVVDNAPNALITGGTSSSTGLQVTLSGTSSTDDHGISSWSWSNNRNGQTSTSSSYSVSNSTAETMIVTLTITDTSGQTDTDTHNIVWTTPTVLSTSLRYDSSSVFAACNFASFVTVYHSGAYTHGSTSIYTTSSLSTFASTGYYGDGSNAIEWSAPGWGMPNSC